MQGQKNESSKVIIIGAGISGMAAAHRLTKLGINVVMLEARDRIGGRINTIKMGNTVIEAGAQWSEIENNPLDPYFHRKGLIKHKLDRRKIIAFDGAEKISIEKAMEDFDKLLVKGNQDPYKMQLLGGNFTLALGFLKEVAQSEGWDLDGDRSDILMIANALNKDRYGIELRDLQVKLLLDEDGKYAFPFLLNKIDLNRPGIAIASLEASKADDSVVTGGYGHVVEALQDEIKEHSGKLIIKLGSEVQRVKQYENGVHVVLKDSKGDESLEEADFIVNTMPLEILKKINQENKFLPRLSHEKQDILANAEMVTFNKIFLKFDSPFWDPANQYMYFHKGEETILVLNLSAYNGDPILVGLYSGEGAKFKGSESDTVVSQRLVDLLKEAYGQAFIEPADCFVSRWHNDPYTLGSWTKDLGSDAAILSKPEGRMYFAGEHVSRYGHTVHGAYISGLQTAGQVAAQFIDNKQIEKSDVERALSFRSNDLGKMIENGLISPLITSNQINNLNWEKLCGLNDQEINKLNTIDLSFLLSSFLNKDIISMHVLLSLNDLKIKQLNDHADLINNRIISIENFLSLEDAQMKRIEEGKDFILKDVFSIETLLSMNQNRFQQLSNQNIRELILCKFINLDKDELRFDEISRWSQFEVDFIKDLMKLYPLQDLIKSESFKQAILKMSIQDKQQFLNNLKKLNDVKEESINGFGDPSYIDRNILGGQLSLASFACLSDKECSDLMSKEKSLQIELKKRAPSDGPLDVKAWVQLQQEPEDQIKKIKP